MIKKLLGDGKLVDLEHLKPLDIDFAVISRSLSKQCRWNGDTNRFYSVAEHCVLMARYVRPEAKIHMLLHDVPEAFTGDIISPIKRKCPEIVALEADILTVIYKAAGIPEPSEIMSQHVRDIDNRILRSELLCMFPPNQEWRGLDDIEPLRVEFHFMSPEPAALAYMYELNRNLGR